MTANLSLLLVLLWLPFLIWSKRSLLFIAYAATMVYIFNQLGLEIVNDAAILWVDLLLFGITVLRLVVEKEK